LQLGNADRLANSVGSDASRAGSRIADATGSVERAATRSKSRLVTSGGFSENSCRARGVTSRARGVDLDEFLVDLAEKRVLCLRFCGPCVSDRRCKQTEAQPSASSNASEP